MFIARISYPEYDSSKNCLTLNEAAWSIRDSMIEEIMYCLLRKETMEIISKNDTIILISGKKKRKVYFTVETEEGIRMPVEGIQ